MPFNEPMMDLMGLSAFGGQQQAAPAEGDLWDQLAAFEFSKLSKKEKKEALSMALIASGGAMMSAPNFMQGMGAAGQAFAGTYGDQLKGLTSPCWQWLRRKMPTDVGRLSLVSRRDMPVKLKHRLLNVLLINGNK
jgi:hypothetical protein